MSGFESCRPDHQRRWCVGLRRRPWLLSLHMDRQPIDAQREWSDQNIGRKAGSRGLPVERGLAAAYVTATMKPSENAASLPWASSGKTWATY
jgi:hypothetical protein